MESAGEIAAMSSEADLSRGDSWAKSLSFPWVVIWEPQTEGPSEKAMCFTVYLCLLMDLFSASL